MANTPRITLRVDDQLQADAARAYGVPTAPVSEVIRYALAVLAGYQNPTHHAQLARGPKQPETA